MPFVLVATLMATGSSQLRWSVWRSCYRASYCGLGLYTTELVRTPCLRTSENSPSTRLGE